MRICFREKEKKTSNNRNNNNKQKKGKKNKQMKSRVILALKPKYKLCGIFSFFF